MSKNRYSIIDTKDFSNKDLKISAPRYNCSVVTLDYLVRLLESGDLTIDFLCQRLEGQWSLDNKSSFIGNMANYFIPCHPIHVVKDAKFKKGRRQIYTIIDGIQTVTTASDFINNKFPITLNIFVNVDGEKIPIRGLYFKDLEEKYPIIADRILENQMCYVKYDDSYTEAEKAKLFWTINNGTPVSNYTKYKGHIIMSSNPEILCTLVDFVSDEFGKFIVEKAQISKNVIKNDKVYGIILETLILMNGGAQSFQCQYINRYIAERLNPEMVDKFLEVFHEIKDDFKSNKIKQCVLPMVLAGAYFTKDKATYLKDIDKFFDDYDGTDSLHEKLRDACSCDGIASKINVMTRWEVIYEIAKYGLKSATARCYYAN